MDFCNAITKLIGHFPSIFLKVLRFKLDFQRVCTLTTLTLFAWPNNSQLMNEFFSRKFNVQTSMIRHRNINISEIWDMRDARVCQWKLENFESYCSRFVLVLSDQLRVEENSFYDNLIWMMDSTIHNTLWERINDLIQFKPNYAGSLFCSFI